MKTNPIGIGSSPHRSTPAHRAVGPSGPAPTKPKRPPHGDRSSLSHESGAQADPGHLAALVQGFGGPPPRPAGGPPGPSGASNVQPSPKLESITSKMKQVRQAEKPLRNSFRPHDLVHLNELKDFARKAPVATTDPMGHRYPEAPPRTDSSPFATRVRQQEKQLGDWILKQSGENKLDPADIYKKSLELNQGDAFNANLTAHNLMKNLTASERNATSSTPEIRQRDSQIENRLMNLRESNDPNLQDKMGPWYHLFGIGVAGAAANGATFGAVKNGGQQAFDQVPRTGSDPGKTATDAWAAKAFRY